MTKVWRVILFVLIVLSLLVGGFALIQRLVYGRSALSGIADVYITFSGMKKKFTSADKANAFMKEQGLVWWDGYALPDSIRFGCTVEEEQSAGMQLFWLNRDAATNDRVVIYLHGGGYVNPPQAVQWKACDKIAQIAGCSIVFPIYLTAPNFTYDQSYAALLALYDSILEDHKPKDIVLMGDSAGGGLALGFAMWLKELAYEQPAQIVLFSPALDITMSNPELKAYEKIDAMLAIAGIVEMGKSWAGGADPTTYRLSPINGDVTNLAPIMLFYGTRELLYPDALKFVSQAAEKAVTIDCYEGRNLGHCWSIYPTPEGAAALKKVAESIKGQ